MIERLLEQGSLVKARQHYEVTRLVHPGQGPERQAVIQDWLEAAYYEVVLVNSALAEAKGDGEQRLPIAVRWVSPALLSYGLLAEEVSAAQGFAETQRLVPKNSELHRAAYQRVRDSLRFDKESPARDMSGLPYARAVALGHASLPHALSRVDGASAVPHNLDLETRLRQQVIAKKAA